MQKSESFNMNGYLVGSYEKYKSFVRFVVVGFINTAVDFLTFTALNSLLGLDKLLCQVAGYSAGIINSFVMNKLWTFEDRSGRDNTARQALRFVAINGISLAVSLVGLKLLNENCGLNIYLSKLLVTIAAQMVNYAGYKLWVFRRAGVKAA